MSKFKVLYNSKYILYHPRRVIVNILEKSNVIWYEQDPTRSLKIQTGPSLANSVSKKSFTHSDPFSARCE